MTVTMDHQPQRRVRDSHLGESAEQRIRDLQNQVANLENSRAAIQLLLTTLKGKHSNLKEKAAARKKKITKLKKTNATLKNNTNELRSDHTKLGKFTGKLVLGSILDAVCTAYLLSRSDVTDPEQSSPEFIVKGFSDCK